uniref:Variant surface glycoprotein 1125.1113 n=1 Tax=Trypanosoma brucei TaxID=5691 RepID=A0A1J0R693_9TRYP|nr:variant surface glycoprotein 1125.1113 [Trypanosoma brucei]
MRTLVSLAFLAKIPVLERVDGTALDNAKEFRTMCGLYNLYSKKTATKPKVTFESGEALVEPMLNLNISTASETWFDNKDNALQTAEKNPDSAAIQQWRNKNQQIVKTDANGTKLYARYAAGDARDKANKRIHALIQEAETLKTAYNTAVQTIADKTKAAQKAITDAVFGEGRTALHKDDFKNGRANQCGKTSSGHGDVGKSIAADIICLCTKAGGTASNECGSGLTGQVDDTGDQTSNAAEAWTALAAACDKMAKPPVLTPQTISSAISAFAAQIGSQNSGSTPTNDKFTLGKVTNSDCDGTAGKLCVNYHAQLGNSGKGIPWVTQLLKAAADLEAADAAETEAKSLKHSISVLRAQAQDAYLSGAYDAAHSQRLQEAAAAGKNAEPACANHKTNSSCTENGCKWKGSADKDGPCVADESKVTAQKNTPGTGEEAGTATTTGCAGHGNDKNACENDKTGDKQNCAFEKGKGGEPETEK